MEFFETLGSLVNCRWKEKNYNEEWFPEIASRALSELPPAQHVSMWDILRWATTADELPPQGDLEADFGDPPLSVYVGRKFFIQVLFWVKGRPAIHQHAFSGAFHVMHGSSIHSLWDFEPQAQVETRLLLGRVSFRNSEILCKGDTRSIIAGNLMFHSTYHLDRPTISVVVRTLSEANKKPQYSLLPPTIAHASLDEIATATRQKQLLRMLFAAGKRADFNQIARHLSGTKDAYSVFELLIAAYASIEDEEERHNLLLTAKLKHPALMEALQPALFRQEIGNEILRLYRTVESAELRFFLATLRNVPERFAIFKLINERFPGRDPIAAIIDWVRKLSEQGTLGSRFEDSWLLMLELLLNDRSDEQIVGAFGERYGHERVPGVTELGELCFRLQVSWLLRSLCLGNPFESKPALPLGELLAPATADSETRIAHKTSTASEPATAYRQKTVAGCDQRADVTKYRCLLDAQPELLVPHALRQTDGSLKAIWTVNPRLQFTANGLCLDVAVPFATAMSVSEPMVWVNDPVTGFLNPFVLGPALASIVSALPGEQLTEDVPAELLSRMSEAGLIYEPAAIESKRNRWHDSMQGAKTKFQAGYAALGLLLHPYTLGAVRAHFRQFIRDGKPRYGDVQTARRWNARNEPVACFLHHQLTPIVEEVAGVPIKASYVYFASYHQGAQLPRHTDRAQCEFSLSMLIDYFPEPVAESPWPLWLDTPEGLVAIHQRLGDTLIYRGRELPHYRAELPAGHTSTHLFFHYVPCDFNGSLD